MTSLPRSGHEPALVEFGAPDPALKRTLLASLLATGGGPHGGAPEPSGPPAPEALTLEEQWARSLRLGADPHARPPGDDGVGDVDMRTEARERVEAVAGPGARVLADFHRACDDADHVAVLADPRGVVARASGGGDFAGEARRLRLVEGAIWDEGLRGTNAIGTALALGRPVRVDGAAHFARSNEGLVCIAAPILDVHGRLVAVLDATSRVERAGALDPGVVLMTARAIEEVLRARAYAGAAGGIGLVETLLERAAQPAFLLERPGRVVRANRAARALSRGSEGGFLMPAFDELCALAGRGRVRLDHAQAHGLLEVQVEALLDHGGAPSALLVFVDSIPDRSRRTPPPRRPDPAPFRAIVGSDPDLEEARRAAGRLASSELPILLLAETGTGKDLFASAIHAASPRRAGPFVAVNCGALQRDLMLAELFGHGPGAYTGAARGGRDGRLAAADGGTLFLDEVADLCPEAQVALLRFLEGGVFRRVGEVTERRVSVRVVAATSLDLADRVARGAFREDLYYRIGGATISIPPLRRRADLPELAAALWEAIDSPSGAPRPELSAGLVAALEGHSWPGNVRELISALTYAAVMADPEPVALPRHLPEHLVPARGAGDAEPSGAGLAAARRAALVRALRDADGNVSRAARTLGVARSTVYRLARRMGVPLKG